MLSPIFYKDGTTGRRLTSFFSGAAVDLRFANGKNPYLVKGQQSCNLVPSSRAYSITSALGLDQKVYAQGCSNCYQGISSDICGQNCSPYGNTGPQLVSGSNQKTGSMYVGEQQCGICYLPLYELCYNPNCH